MRNGSVQHSHCSHRFRMWETPGEGVKGIGTIIACRVRIAGKSPVSSCIQIGVIKYLCPFSKPCVYQKSQIIHFHLVHTVFGEQGK